MATPIILSRGMRRKHSARPENPSGPDLNYNPAPILRVTKTCAGCDTEFATVMPPPGRALYCDACIATLAQAVRESRLCRDRYAVQHAT